MGTDKETLYKQAMTQGKLLRKKITRRRMLQTSAAMAAAAVVTSNVREARAASHDTHGPGWYTDDSLTGKVTCITFSGQRWGLPPAATIPTFLERFPNVEMELIDEPVGEAYTKIQMRAASKSSSFNSAIADSNQWSAIGQMQAMESFEPLLAADPGYAKDYFADVPENITNGYKLPQIASGETFGLSCDGNCKLGYYRKDKFEEAGIAKVPETWDEAIAAAKALHDPDNDQYGFVSTARRGLYAGLELYQIMRSLGGDWFDGGELLGRPGDYQPQFDTDIGREAMDILLRIMEYRHPVTLNAADDEANAALANGTAVYAPMEWGTSILTDPEFTEFADVFGTEIVPKGTGPGSAHRPLMGGFAYYVNTSGNDKPAAFEWVKHLNAGDYTDTRIGEAYATNTGQPARISLLDKFSSHQPYFAGLVKSFTVGTPGFPWVPETFTLADLLGNEVTAAIVGEKKPNEALKAADESNRQVMEDGGYYN